MSRFAIAVSAAGVLVSGLAIAQPPQQPQRPPRPRTQGLAPLPTNMPNRCIALAYVPPSSRIPGPEIAAHISAANCLAEEEMNHVQLRPTAASVQELNAAVMPAIAILDGVIATGDPYWSFIAQDAKRDLYTGMIVRQRKTISGGDVAEHNRLEPALDPWRHAAVQAQVAMNDLHAASPDLGTRDAVAHNICVSSADRQNLLL